ncbi:MAG TPA: adenylate/guanylate cyclase domain-containing protein [Candidatus Dormibacteraeota bacterium]
MVRRSVTVLFSDLKGSTSLGERLDPEALREVLDAYFEAMREAIERHGGFIEKYIGDAVMAVFGVPRAHEDDALRALRAASDMQVGLAALNPRLQERFGVQLENRTGVSTGEVVTGDLVSGQRLVTGDAVNVSARLEQNAPANEVLFGERTFRLVRGGVSFEKLAPIELKGKAQRVPAYRLVGVKATADEPGRRTDTPLVGRKEELAALRAARERSHRRRAAELVTVIAPAGTGKSRLLEEFTRRASVYATVLRGRCLSYGEGITFWPIAAIARAAAGITDRDSVDEARAKLTALVGSDSEGVSERVASVIGLSADAYPVQETFWAVRQLLQGVAGHRGAVVLIDDIHWAEPTLLDLIEYLRETIAGAPVLILCSSRPELLDQRESWQADRPDSVVLTLQPLTDEESGDVVSNLLGGSALSAAVRGRIVEAAQGNPLFVEQLLSMLIDDGTLQRDAHGKWVVTARVETIEVPPSIGALLTARLDRLPAVERTVLERGAVIGHSFRGDAVVYLCPEDVRTQVPPSLTALVRKELVAAVQTATLADDDYRFAHALVSEAAYRVLLKRTRAELHERFVQWLELTSRDRLTELREILGYHLEQSYLAVTQLGPPDMHALEVGRRASGLLGDAGEQARARGDMPAAGGLLRRAAALIPEPDASRSLLLLHAGEALSEMGRFDDANAALAQAADDGHARDDIAMETTASVARLLCRFMADPESAATIEVTTAAHDAIAELEQLDAPAGLARAWRLLMYAGFIEANFAAAEAAARRAVAEAARDGDRVLELRYLAALGSCVVYSPTPVSDAIQQCEQLLERAGGERRTVAITYSALSHLEAMRGNFTRARELYASSRSTLVELGFTHSAAIVSLQSGPAEMLAGDLARAEDELRRDLASLTELGDRGYTSTVAALLAEVLFAQGRREEAGQFAEICRETAAPEDVAAQYHLCAIQAKLAAAEGRLEQAEALAREGVKHIRATDIIDLQGDALVTLAGVLRAAGDVEGAGAMLRDALALFERKGNLVSAGRARAELAELTTGSRGVAV